MHIFTHISNLIVHNILQYSSKTNKQYRSLKTLTTVLIGTTEALNTDTMRMRLIHSWDL